MARFININRFLLHAMYRNRLIRAYLGASRAQIDRERTLITFTGSTIWKQSRHERPAV